MTRALVAIYLAAIVAANLIVTHKGPTWSVYLAFVFIGLDLVCRDRLHDAWHGHVVRNMAALIVAGSAISYVVNRDAGRIALASCLAFGAAATADAVVHNRCVQAVPQILQIAPQSRARNTQRRLDRLKRQTTLVIQQLVDAVKAFGTIQAAAPVMRPTR